MNSLIENNSIYSNYGDEILEDNELDGRKTIVYVQLTNEDIRDIISRPSNKLTLEDRLISDFNCDYNFRKPAKKHINEYPKYLLKSIKASELISPTPIRKKTRRRKMKKKEKRKSISKIARDKMTRNNTKRIKYTPVSKARYTKRKYHLTPRSNKKLLELQKKNDSEFPSIEKTIYD
tara:strand:- start:2220 stop:2750 length:531 start_codon:yes stop_codon:yes gene_type:complete